MRKIALGCGIVLVLLMLSPFLVVGGAALFNSRTGADTTYANSALLADPPPPLTEALTIRVVTFNIQDLMIVGAHRPERMRAIGETLTRLDPDIVGFQEAFIAADRDLLKEALAGSRLRHFRYYRSATAGSGLFTASAWPIREAYFHRFTVSNAWHKLWEGDWWAGKGVALARIELPGGAFIDFYNTHAQAAYGTSRYDGVRMVQMTELAGFINQSRTGTAPALLTGDMNCRPDDGDFRAARDNAQLERLMDIDSRIDHIFGVKDARYRYDVLESAAIQGRVPVGGRTVSLSDHKGYLSEIRITPAAAEQG
jgi:endonuclease/exonuclease/phosphatase family metal-dependent hydrolase